MAGVTADVDKIGMDAAFVHAKKSYDEGGVPIGAALVYHGGGETRILGHGHNQRIQKASPILHGEKAALENAGRLKPEVYRNSTMVCASHRRGACGILRCLLLQYTTLRYWTCTSQ